MPAMLQDGRVIVVVVVFVAFSLLTETNSASSGSGKCRYCKEFIQSILPSSNLLRIFEEKSSFAQKFFQNIDEDHVPITSKLDFVKFCTDNCVVSGDNTENDENNSIRSKRGVTEGIYKYFSPPFSHVTDDQFERRASETAEELEEIGKPHENLMKAYQGCVKDKRIGSGCECVKEQEESMKRLYQTVEKYMEKIIEHFRGMLRDEIRNQVLPERQRLVSSVGHQQNYFMISILTPNPTSPMAQFVQPNASQTIEKEKIKEIIETTTAGHITEDPETHPTSEAKTDLTTTEMLQRGTEFTEETTTEVTIDLPEANVMRQSDDEILPDCENKEQEPPQHLPALLQAFKPKNK